MSFEEANYVDYVAAYDGQRGGRLLAVSAKDGRQLAEFELEAAPAWDSLAVAKGKLYMSLRDGTVVCLGQ